MKALLIPSTAVILSVALCSDGSPANDLRQCHQNLASQFQAIQAYRLEHRSLPERLTDLVPHCLPQKEALLCPADRLSPSEHPQDPAAGPAAPCSYIYEFEPRELANPLARSLGVTLRDWRQLQMGRIGSDIPMVRCPNHGRTLILTFGGEIRESPSDWEEDFAKVIRPGDLSLETLLMENFHLDMVRIPQRDPKTPRRFIDLTEHYNGSLKGWVESSLESNLSELPPGLSLLEDTMFDIRGVIQVGSKHYSMKHEPLVLSNIVLGLACRSLTFLHGTIHPETEGRAIGQYVFWFEDGSSEIFPIHYGRHSFDWHKAPGSHLDKLTDSRLIWKGANATGPEGPKAVHLYATRWTNPHPERAIRQMSLVSLKTQSAPFLVAITAEVFGVNGE